MKSALECVLDESLRGYSTSSHERLYEFFTASAAAAAAGQGGEGLVDAFRASFSRAYADSKVFGQKSTLNVEHLASLLYTYIDSDQCGLDIDDADKDSSSGKRAAFGPRGSTASKAADMRNQCAHLLYLCSRLNRLEEKVRVLVHRPQSGAEAVTAVASRIMRQRKNLRAVKVAWSGSRRPLRLSGTYHPLRCGLTVEGNNRSKSALMRAVKSIYGISQTDLPLDEMSSSNLVGYKISNEDACVQSLAWELYSDLCHLSAFQHPFFHLFPIPILASREADGSLLAFEVPLATPVQEILLQRNATAKAILARTLRCRAGLIALWAKQLGCAYDCLRLGLPSNIIDIWSITIENLFIREDGRLILGNLEAPAAPGTPTETAATRFASFSISFLLDVLCLTRTTSLSVVIGAHKNELDTEGINESNSEQLCVVVGSSLSIRFAGFGSRMASVQIKATNVATPIVASDLVLEPFDSSCSTISVSIIRQVPVAIVDAEDSGPVQRRRDETIVAELQPLVVPPLDHMARGSDIGITIRGVSPGNIIIGLRIPGFLISGTTLYKYFYVEVAPKVPVNNMHVVELLGILEASGSVGPGFDALAFAASSMTPFAGEDEFSLMEILGGLESDDPLEKQWSDTRRDVSKGAVRGDLTGGGAASGTPLFGEVPRGTGTGGRREKGTDVEQLALYRRYGADNF